MPCGVIVESPTLRAFVPGCSVHRHQFPRSIGSATLFIVQVFATNGCIAYNCLSRDIPRWMQHLAQKALAPIVRLPKDSLNSSHAQHGEIRSLKRGGPSRHNESCPGPCGGHHHNPTVSPCVIRPESSVDSSCSPSRHPHDPRRAASH